MGRGPSLLARATGALGALLLVALAARVAWELLRPLFPVLLAVFVPLFILRLVIGRFRQGL